MRLDRPTALFLLATALLGYDVHTIHAAQARHTPHQHGGPSSQHRGSGGAVERRHQWFADPERGWVRGDEADGANDGRRPTKRSHQNRYRSNGSGRKL